MDNKLSELSKPVAYMTAEGVAITHLDFESGSWGMHNAAKSDDMWCPLYSQEYVSAMLEELEAKDKRIAELEARLATPVIGSCDSDPMREYFTCNREGDFYFTTLGSVPGRTYTLYRNEAEALFIGLRDALSAGFTVEGDSE